jgi:hypothetical protein
MNHLAIPFEHKYRKNQILGMYNAFGYHLMPSQKCQYIEHKNQIDYSNRILKTQIVHVLYIM